MAIAIPIPPPIHKDATPFFNCFRSSKCRRVTRILAPEKFPNSVI